MGRGGTHAAEKVADEDYDVSGLAVGGGGELAEGVRGAVGGEDGEVGYGGEG